MRVLLVTSWNAACGVSEHSRELKAAVEVADPTIRISPSTAALDPLAGDWTDVDLIHLNYHGALHSRWTPEVIAQVDRPIVVTYHDTGVPNSDRCKAVCAAADAFVVHEPYDDLPGNGRYWRMGVPDRPAGVVSIGRRPRLGSIGFPFPWKHFDLLAEITARLGWDLRLIAPTATEAQCTGWRQANPRTEVYRDFLPHDQALAYLAACDATAFPYVCHNTGQSGAILQGVAARKPVIAFSTCRQFRALYADPVGRRAIRWAETVEDLERHLFYLQLARVDPATVALAEQDSWTRLGQKYAALYREVVGG
jgi:hypothetical protein